MYEAAVTRTYRPYITITREAANARGFDRKYLHEGRDYRLARAILGLFPDAVAMDLCSPRHNSRTSRYVPPPGYIVYVKTWLSSNLRVRYTDAAGEFHNITPQVQALKVFKGAKK